MTAATSMLAIDLGAQSGRVMLGRFDGRRLSATEVHRFANVPVAVGDRLHWDVLGLHASTLTGMRAARLAGGDEIASVAVDTWGLDFALLDRDDRLVANPVHHRDRRTDTAMADVHERIPARRLYELTGIQMMAVNTLYQLWAMASTHDPALEAASSLVMMPDLFNQWLCGVRACEFTGVTTTQCYDPRAGAWAWEVIDALGLPARLFGECIAPASVLGDLSALVAAETGIEGARVIAAAGHDTAAAVAAVPFRRADSVYISSGTWSLVGLEIPAPRIDEGTFAANLTNEGGVAGTFRLLRNVTGLWLLHECRRAWAHERAWGFGELAELAESAPPLACLIDPNDAVFLAPGDMPARVREYCAATAQPVPRDEASVVRCILESLALKYRHTIDLLASASGLAPREVHIVGGGARNRQLCQWTADAVGLPVLAGPVEAASIGNLAVQAMALGELHSLAQARELVRNSFAVEVYEPRARERWDEAFVRFEAIAAARAAGAP